MVSAWKTEKALNYIAQFFETFRIVYWLKKLKFDIYVIIFYIVIFLVFLVILDFLYVAITFKHKRYSFAQPIQILRIAIILIVSILYIPILGNFLILTFAEFFFSFSECEQDSTGILVHSVYGEVKCFDSIHILHAVLSYVIIIIFVLLTVLSIKLYYENRYTKDPTAKYYFNDLNSYRLSSRIDIIQLISKTIYCFIFVFFKGVFLIGVTFNRTTMRCSRVWFFLSSQQLSFCST